MVFRAWIAPLPRGAARAATALMLLGLAAAPISVGLQGLDALDMPLAGLGRRIAWATGCSTSYGATTALAALAMALGLAALALRRRPGCPAVDPLGRDRDGAGPRDLRRGRDLALHPTAAHLTEAEARPAAIHIHTAQALADLTVTPGQAGPATASIVVMTGDFGPLDRADRRADLGFRDRQAGGRDRYRP